MKKGIEMIIKISMVIFFMVAYGVIMNFIIYPIFIPDDCYYHNHDTTFTIEILFDFPAANGYHPSPTKLGYLLFGIFGFLVGTKVIRTVKSRRNGISTID